MTRLQVKASAIGKILTSLEQKYNNTHGDGMDGLMKKSPSAHLGHPPNKKAHMEIIKIQSIPPFNASKIRKSPSTESKLEEKTDIIDEKMQDEPDNASKPEE